MMTSFETDCVVIGAGVVGLAVARALARQGREVLILEKEDDFGTQTSARNSEVIHAGIYYPKGSLKARACVRGRRLLYTYLSSRNLPYRKCGKLIVASSEGQVGDLAQIAGRARDNGVDDLVEIDGPAAMAMEPALDVSGALVSPSTGILDSHAYMVSLLGEAEDHGASLALNTYVERAEPLPDGRTKLWCGGAEPCILTAKGVANCAGLGAPDVAARFGGLKPEAVPTAYYAKGNYFTLSRKAPFSRLIYPVPEPGGLGVHLTLDLAGLARFGPDVQWIDEIDYEVDPARSESFYDAIRAYWPDLPDAALSPDYAGVRPKIAAPGEANADFVISTPDEHGAEGQVHMFGIESPGLTASLALAEHVAEALG